MSINIKEVAKEKLIDYRLINMRVEVESSFILKLINNGLGGIILEEVEVDKHVIDPSFGEDPLSWDKEFDISNWGFFIAYDEYKPIGAVALAYNTKGVNMLANRSDLTVVWDIRILEEYKCMGIGTELFKKVEEWANKRYCSQIKVETQNNNVKACKFYKKQGFILGEINKYAYYGEDDSTMLVWYKNLK